MYGEKKMKHEEEQPKKIDRNQKRFFDFIPDYAEQTLGINSLDKY